MSPRCITDALTLQKRLNDMTQRIADRDRQRLYNPDDFENPTAARIEDALTTLEDAEGECDDDDADQG